VNSFAADSTAMTDAQDGSSDTIAPVATAAVEVEADDSASSSSFSSSSFSAAVAADFETKAMKESRFRPSQPQYLYVPITTLKEGDLVRG
jgi:hypothetical protein